MKLLTLNYSQFDGTPREWSISGMLLGPINLVVGKNASGKSRALSVIHALGKLVSGREKALSSGLFDATFDDGGQTIRYSLEMIEKKVVREEFIRDDNILMTRGAGGSGTIRHEKEGKDIEFQTPESDIAAVSRTDNIQHKFLEPLRSWGDGVRNYLFGETLGRTVVAFLVKDGPPPDPADANAVVGLFRKAIHDHPRAFAPAVVGDMIECGFDITDVGVMSPTDIAVQGPLADQVNPQILFAQERHLDCKTQGLEMSQGMFRALAVLIHLNYAIMASKPSCIIVDDIGEGLDFDRSCRLIEVLRRKSLQSSLQLIMSTNDQFVMNNVPLEEWSVLQRDRNHVHVRNHTNARPAFEQFKFVGMSNFTFFEMDFVNGLPREGPSLHEQDGCLRRGIY